MAVTVLITLNQQLLMANDSGYTSGNWTNADTSPSYVTINGDYQGSNLNWGGFNTSVIETRFASIPYQGYSSNFSGDTKNASPDVFQSVQYQGYTTNWGGQSLINTTSEDNSDINSVIDFPKEFTVFYKLKGYNNNLDDYETWVISENITGRPELFNPEGEPPNVERDLFKTPPSGNPLTDIIIVGRWIDPE